MTWSSWRVNYKVEPTIPSLAKRNRWIQLAWVGARRILVCIRSNRSPGPRTMPSSCDMDGWKKDSIRGDPVIDLLSTIRLHCKKSYGSSFNYHPRIYLWNLLMGRRSMERLRSRSIQCAVRSSGERKVSFF